ncbi:hypothetical protein BJ508DRAFT_311195 [Ascobolus immersus RN42]|uniref:Uncharacterized protein n=1 Tax=Ascobolus immersus RN42 TaxID=1160509 RepID=A0A3N4HUS6_ASCIM|nr:hypothetical protein BJ508DRAFT_311195 [Ascobolus immersus RN42]
MFILLQTCTMFILFTINGNECTIYQQYLLFKTIQICNQNLKEATGVFNNQKQDDNIYNSPNPDDDETETQGWILVRITFLSLEEKNYHQEYYPSFYYYFWVADVELNYWRLMLEIEEERMRNTFPNSREYDYILGMIPLIDSPVVWQRY